MPSRALGVLAAIGAMTAVGTGVTVSWELTDYPFLGAQALRYGLASALLAGILLLLRRPIPRPRGSDWLWLAGVAVTGLVLFNLAVIRSVEQAEPAATAVVIGAVPLVLLIADSVRLRRRPSRRLVVGAMAVVVGAALVQGGGRATLDGLVWAVVAMLCEAAFTLLAVPVLGRLGAVGISVHTPWIAAVMLGAMAVAFDGGGALPAMDTGELVAVAYLAVILTAVAFVLWYSAVGTLGPATAGLFAGLMPVAAALSGIIPGLTTLTPPVIGGSIVVGAGIAIGLSARTATDRRAATPARLPGGLAQRARPR